MAEYIKIKNNTIVGIFCGATDEEDVIILPANHEVREGDSLNFYTDNFKRKSDIQLMQEKLIPIPQGYKIDNDKLVEMTFNERIIAGIDELPRNMKIVDNKLVEKSEEEKLADMTTEEKSTYHRQKRDVLLNSVLWKVERHSQEERLGMETTLSEEEYINLLTYIQNLRNLPQQAGFPDEVMYPEL